MRIVNRPTPNPVPSTPRKAWQKPAIVLERALVASAQDGAPPVPFGAGPLTSSQPI